MANISITSHCNRDCAYCFSRSALGRKDSALRHVDLEFFERALDLLERSAINETRLVGGEPTLHPDFPALLERVQQRDFRLTVFSNGLAPASALEALESFPRERLTVLVNINHPSQSDADEGRRRFPFLRRLGQSIVLGHNISEPGAKLGFLLDLAQELPRVRAIRLGLAHPVLGEENQYLHTRHYGRVGRKVSVFAAQATELNLRIELDCGFVPCMFPDGCYARLGECSAHVGRRCGPVVDLLLDGRVVPCFPLSHWKSWKLPPPRKLRWLREQMAAALEPYRELGIFRECRICPLPAQGLCHRGCRAQALLRLRSGSRYELPIKTGAASTEHGRNVRPKPSGASPGTKTPAARGFRESMREETRWALPYVDQPLSFWRDLAGDHGSAIAEVYFPLPEALIPSGRPAQPRERLKTFLQYAPLPKGVLINPVVLPTPAATIAPALIETLYRLVDEYGISSATVTNLELAWRIRDALPELSLCASVLMDIAFPQQAMLLRGVCETLVPASRIMRNRPALKALQGAFDGRIRLMVNEACIPDCTFRTQHFYEMASSCDQPASLCEELLTRDPWRRLTGAWVLPQHLHLFDGLYDELKLAGRVTLGRAARYRRVFEAYRARQVLGTDDIGGGPASANDGIEISEDFYQQTLECARRCDQCDLCATYWQTHHKGKPSLAPVQEREQGSKIPRP